MISILSLLAGLACAGAVALLMWQIGRWASQYMIRERNAPPGVAMLRPQPDGVEVAIPGTHGQIRVWHRGSGTAVVLIPDAGATAGAVLPLWTLLAGYGYRVITWESPASLRGQSLEDAVMDLDLVIRHFRLDRPLLAGCGWGAYVMIQHQAGWIQAPAARARAMVSVAGFAGQARPAGSGKFRQIFQGHLGYQQRLAAFGEGISAEALQAIGIHYQLNPGSYQRHSFPEIFPSAQFAQLDLPAWLLASRSDEILSPLHTQRLAAALPRAEVIWAGNSAGHMLHWECPGWVVDCIREADATIRQASLAAS